MFEFMNSLQKEKILINGNRSLAFVNLKKYNEAIELFDRILKFEPKKC